MTAGLPGAGIGGLFYLLGALLAPAWEAGRALRGNATPRRWRLVIRQFLLAASILAGIWLTGWLIGFLLSFPFFGGEHGGARIDSVYVQVIGRRMAVIALMTLVAVLLAVEALRLWQLVVNRHDRSADSGRRPHRSGVAPNRILAAERAAVGASCPPAE